MDHSRALHQIVRIAGPKGPRGPGRRDGQHKTQEQNGNGDGGDGGDGGDVGDGRRKQTRASAWSLRRGVGVLIGIVMPVVVLCKSIWEGHSARAQKGLPTACLALESVSQEGGRRTTYGMHVLEAVGAENSASLFPFFVGLFSGRVRFVLFLLSRLHLPHVETTTHEKWPANAKTLSPRH